MNKALARKNAMSVCTMNTICIDNDSGRTTVDPIKTCTLRECMMLWTTGRRAPMISKCSGLLMYGKRIAAKMIATTTPKRITVTDVANVDTMGCCCCFSSSSSTFVLIVLAKEWRGAVIVAMLENLFSLRFLSRPLLLRLPPFPFPGQRSVRPSSPISFST